MAKFTKYSFSNTPPLSNPSSSPFSFYFLSSASCGSTSSASTAPSAGSVVASASSGLADSSSAPSVSCGFVSSSIARSVSCGSTSSSTASSVSCGSSSSSIARSFSFGATSFSASSVPFIRFGSASSTSSSALSVRFGSSAPTSSSTLTSTTSTSSGAIASTTAPLFGSSPPASSTGLLFVKPSASSSATAVAFPPFNFNNAASSSIASTTTAAASVVSKPSFGVTATPTTPAAAVPLFYDRNATPPAAPSPLATTSFCGLQASTSASEAVSSSTTTAGQTSNAVAVSSGNVTSPSTASTTASLFSASKPLTATPTPPAAFVPLFSTPTCTSTPSLVVTSASPVSPAAMSTAPATFIGFPLNSPSERMSAASTFTAIPSASAATTTATAPAGSLASVDPTLHQLIIRGPVRSRTRRRLWNRAGQSKVGRGSHYMQLVSQQQPPQPILDNETNQIGNKFVYRRHGKRPLEEDETVIPVRKSFATLSSIPENINMRVGEWIELKEATLPADVLERITGPAECKGERYAPQWDVNPNESLSYDFPEQGGTLGHRMLKGMILPHDRPSRVSKSNFAKTSHLLAQFCGSYLEVAELGLHYQRDIARVSGELFDTTNKLKYAEQKAAHAEASINAAIGAKEAAEKHLAESKHTWNLEKSSLESNIVDLKKQLLAMEAGQAAKEVEKTALKL